MSFADTNRYISRFQSFTARRSLPPSIHISFGHSRRATSKRSSLFTRALIVTQWGGEGGMWDSL